MILCFCEEPGASHEVNKLCSRSYIAICVEDSPSEQGIIESQRSIRGALKAMVSKISNRRDSFNLFSPLCMPRFVTALSISIGALLIAVHPVKSAAQTPVPANDPGALYQQAQLPIEQRVDDLLGRMTLKEKVRQLDLYTAATALVDAHTDETHATATAHFLPEKAQALLGDLGVGGIHDLNPTPEQANTIQQWVLAHNRLRYPRYLSKRACMDSIQELFSRSHWTFGYMESGACQRRGRSHCG